MNGTQIPVTDDQLDEWIKKRCSVKHTKKLLDARYIQHYLPETGFLFQVMGGYNFKFKSSWGSTSGDPVKITYGVSTKNNYDKKRQSDTFVFCLKILRDLTNFPSIQILGDYSKTHTTNLHAWSCNYTWLNCRKRR